MTTKAGGASHPEWDAYVEEIRTLAAQRTGDFIRARAKGWVDLGKTQAKCLSPFRDEKTASFYVDLARGLYHDFGTGEGGDLIRFVERYQRCSGREAIDLLAREFNTPDWEGRKKGRGAPAADPETLLAQWHGEKTAERVFDCATWLVQFCHDRLPSMVREHVRRVYSYTDAFIDLQRVGYCPNALFQILTDPEDRDACPFSDDELLTTGWFVKAKGGSVAASLANRIIFPYWKNGQARYAIGREYFGRFKRGDVAAEYYPANEWDQGKYKKLPLHSEKRTYISPHVQNILWNEDCLRTLRDGTLFISEGVTDAGILAMLGFHVISPVTVAFRKEDVERVLELLRRYRVKRVVILNDNDTKPDALRPGVDRHPGLEGAKRMAAGIWTAGFDVRIGRLPRPEGVSKIDINELVSNALREAATP